LSCNCTNHRTKVIYLCLEHYEVAPHRLVVEPCGCTVLEAQLFEGSIHWHALSESISYPKNTVEALVAAAYQGGRDSMR
jgi:hypothetical protein